MLQETFRDNAVSQNKTFLLCKRFKDGQKRVDDDERSGRPSTSRTLENKANVREAILADQRQTIHDICEEVGLSYRTVQCTVADNLNMKHSSVRFVPRLQSDDQKAHRVAVCSELKQQARDDPIFISNIITVMKHGYMVMTLGLSSSRRSGSPQFTSAEKSASSSQQCQV